MHSKCSPRRDGRQKQKGEALTASRAPLLFARGVPSRTLSRSFYHGPPPPPSGQAGACIRSPLLAVAVAARTLSLRPGGGASRGLSLGLSGLRFGHSRTEALSSVSVSGHALASAGRCRGLRAHTCLSQSARACAFLHFSAQRVTKGDSTAPYAYAVTGTAVQSRDRPTRRWGVKGTLA